MLTHHTLPVFKIVGERLLATHIYDCPVDNAIQVTSLPDYRYTISARRGYYVRPIEVYAPSWRLAFKYLKERGYTDLRVVSVIPDNRTIVECDTMEDEYRGTLVRIPSYYYRHVWVPEYELINSYNRVICNNSLKREKYVRRGALV